MEEKRREDINKVENSNIEETVENAVAKMEETEEKEDKKPSESPVSSETSEPAESPPKEESKQEENKTPEKPKKKSFWKRNKYWILFLVKLGAIAGILYLLYIYVFSFTFMHGNYMFPAVRDGDLCITYKLDPYNAGDVVLYKYGDGYRVGRVVAKGGETYDITEQGPTINGSGASENIFYPTEKGEYELPVTLEEDEVLILNDMRTEMEDGRLFGPTKQADLLGKVVFIFRVRGF